MGIHLLPIQGIEAVCLFVLFLVLLIGYQKAKEELSGQIAGTYAISYGAVRLILEAFRGDAVRGIWGGLSTSQWISIGLLLLGFLMIFAFGKNKKKSAT